MKLKVTITGSRVHDVGYRVHLLNAAMNLALPGFSSLNWTEDGKQQVIALAEGDETRIGAFRQFVEANRPERAEVSEMCITEYDGEVGRTSEFAMMCSLNQLNRAIPILLEIRDATREIQGSTREILSATKEIQGSNKEIQEATRTIQDNTKCTPQILEEVKGLREDLNTRQEARLGRMEKDVRALKNRLGVR